MLKSHEFNFIKVEQDKYILSIQEKFQELQKNLGPDSEIRKQRIKKLLPKTANSEVINNYNENIEVVSFLYNVNKKIDYIAAALLVFSTGYFSHEYIVRHNLENNTTALGFSLIAFATLGGAGYLSKLSADALASNVLDASNNSVDKKEIQGKSKILTFRAK